MDIEYKGGNCVVITHKKDTYVVDPGIAGIGLKDQGAGATAMLITQARFAAKKGEETLAIVGPGEYEVHNCSIKGIAARAQLGGGEGDYKATVYSLDIEDTKIAILGHITPKLSNDQLEELGVVDVLIVPVGGYGYTLDPKDAVSLVRAIEPKIVIPTHYAEDGVTYEVPQAPIEEFVKELGLPIAEVTAKLKLKPGQLPSTLTLYQVSRSK